MLRITKYSTENCAACVAIEPVLERIEQMYHLTIERLDASDAPRHDRVRSVPTIIVRYGQNKASLVGNRNFPDISEAIERVRKS